MDPQRLDEILRKYLRKELLEPIDKESK